MQAPGPTKKSRANFVRTEGNHHIDSIRCDLLDGLGVPGETLGYLGGQERGPSEPELLVYSVNCATDMLVVVFNETAYLAIRADHGGVVFAAKAVPQLRVACA